ncbi:MAG: helix-turn-helix domain-containing protein [Streptosporangiales bacterium]|nr:helix-turn-helix domain-containing protein [Streptosporangiales bacterium]
MAVRGLGDAFRVVMQRHGWTGAHLARQLRTSQPWVSMVLSGRRDPGMRRSTELLERLGWELELVPSGEVDPVKRREFFAVAAAVAFVPAPTASPYSDAAYVTKLADRLMHHEAQLGGAPLAREAVRHAARVAPGLRSRDSALHAAASGLCRQAALIVHDVRDLAQAERLAALSLRFARRTDDPAAQVHAYDALSLTAAYSPDGRGVEYARRGLAVRGAGDADRAALSARLGRTLALMPDQATGARRYLEQALTLAGDSGAVTAEIYGNTGIGFTDLGLPGAAEAHLASAVELTASAPFVQSLYLARQVKMAIRARNPDAAMPVMLALAGVVPVVDSPRLTIHLRHILDGTRRWAAMPGVRHARDAIREAARGR